MSEVDAVVLATPDHAEISALLQADAPAAHDRLRKWARQGDASAQLALGQLLINGVGAERDGEEALHWFRSAASSGMPMAMNMIGRCYEYGVGTDVDLSLAAVWFREAARHDCDWAIYNYAHLLSSGRGVTQDRAEAFCWFARAAALGNARAWNFLGRFHESGWGTPVDHSVAIDCYRRSAEGGDFRGQASYASVLVEASRIDEALEWLRKSVATATPKFLSELLDELEKSPHAALREFAIEAKRTH